MTRTGLRLRDDQGQTIALVAVMLGFFIVVILVVVNGTRAFIDARSLQNAADAAALASAYDLKNGDSSSRALQTDSSQYTTMNRPAQDGLPPTLSACSAATTTNCYEYPYVDSDGVTHSDQVEVLLHNCLPTLLGQLIGYGCVGVSAHAVAGITSGGTPPPYSFISLNTGCQNHTLLVKAGGNLRVDNAVYVNSCNAPKDAFDVFGGGSLTAPAINVVGGWELHDGSTVSTPLDSVPCYGGTTNPDSSLYWSGTTFQTPPPSGCPTDGAPILPDPFASVVGPTPGAAGGAASALVTHLGRSSNVATLTTNTALNAYPGASITVSDLPDPYSSFNGTYTVLSSSGNTLTYSSSGPVVPSGSPTSVNVTAAALQNYVGTLTTATPLSVAAGDSINVALSPHDAALDGTFAVTSVSGNTITYQDTQAAATNNYAIKQETLASDGTATVTLGSTPSQRVGDQLTVTDGGGTQDPVFDGTYTITGISTGAKTISYRPDPFVMTTTAGTINNGTVTLSISGPSDPPTTLASNGTLTVATGDPRFDGNQRPTRITIGSPDTIQYVLAPFQTTGSWTADASAHTATVTTTASDTGLQYGDTVNVNLKGAPGCINGNNHVVVSASASQVTYSIPANCSPGSSGAGTGTVTIQSASNDDLNGTATVSALPAVGAPGGSTAMAAVDEAQTSTGGTVSASTIAASGGLVTVDNTGTASSPTPYEIPGGSVTLSPGTYYGGICIGAAVGSDCSTANCTTTVPSTANVTLNPGVYIMAGGGFHVCGGSSLHAPQVLIYDTEDPSPNNTGYGAIGQVQINTTGSVELGPQTSGPWAGLTIFENRNLTVTQNGTTLSSDSCNAKSGKPQEWDIALQSMADAGNGNGALGSISGTIYAPADQRQANGSVYSGAEFGVAVSGTANLAVITSCIFVNGVNDTFDFKGSNGRLFSLSTGLLG